MCPTGHEVVLQLKCTFCSMKSYQHVFGRYWVFAVWYVFFIRLSSVMLSVWCWHGLLLVLSEPVLYTPSILTCKIFSPRSYAPAALVVQIAHPSCPIILVLFPGLQIARSCWGSDVAGYTKAMTPMRTGEGFFVHQAILRNSMFDEAAIAGFRHSSTRDFLGGIVQKRPLVPTHDESTGCSCFLGGVNQSQYVAFVCNAGWQRCKSVHCDSSMYNENDCSCVLTRNTGESRMDRAGCCFSRRFLLTT